MGILDFLKRNKKEEEVNKSPNIQKKEDKSLLNKKSKSAQKKDENKKEDKPKKELLKASKKDTKNAYRILIKPLITEKATNTGTFLFAVDKRINKQEVAKAIKVVYGVEPRKVNIMNFGGKNVRWGKAAGATKAWKKAIVYLKKGDNIELYGS